MVGVTFVVTVMGGLALNPRSSFQVVKRMRQMRTKLFGAAMALGLSLLGFSHGANAVTITNTNIPIIDNTQVGEVVFSR